MPPKMTRLGSRGPQPVTRLRHATRKPRPSAVDGKHLTSTGRSLRRPYEAFLDKLRHETVAGMILLGAVALAFAWANSTWKDSYHAIAATYIGPESIGLRMSVAHWAADGLLAIFFFMIGLELKTEFVTGSLRKFSRALLPMLAAVFGMAVPATIYAVTQIATGSPYLEGWAIPTATDIAFAVALLGIFGRGLPPALRVFLLTLAVVDDLLAIVVIAIFYSDGVDFVLLAACLAVVAVFGLLVQRRSNQWWLLILLGILAWALMYRSGVHATIAGVLLGATVPARTRKRERDSMTHRYVHQVGPVSAGLALPIFAFFSAGITISGGIAMLANPVATGVMAGLVLGKVIGIFGGVALLTRFTPLTLGNGVDLPDVLGVSLLAGIGFTVSMLIAQLSFGDGEQADSAKLAIVVASLIAAILGGVALQVRVHTRVRGHGAR